MKVELLMPQMGESITEAPVSRWKKQVGDSVTKDETILEISTDKVDSEVPAPASGILVEIKVQEGGLVPVKSLLAVIDTEGKAVADSKNSAKETSKAVKNDSASAKSTASSSPKESPPVITAAINSKHSPLVEQLAEKHGISISELDNMPASGVGGRLTKEDLLFYIENKKNSKSKTMNESPSKLSSSSKQESSPSSSVARNIDFGTSDKKIIPMDTMRKAIAEHMVRSKHTSPHVYTIQLK